jgi:hypothetical protein
MKITKTIDIWICDICGNETNYKPPICSKCGKELCPACMVYHDFSVTTSKGYGGTATVCSFTQCGYNILCCHNCAIELKDKLEAFGFKEFTKQLDSISIAD